MWSSGLLWLSFAVCYSSSFAVFVSDHSCHAKLSALKSEAETCHAVLGAMESQKKLLETHVKSLKTMRASNSNGLPNDCAGHMEAGNTKSGIYRILPIHSTIDAPFEVYCDMETDGGGWTVFQRRDDYGEPRQDFYLDWNSYKRGFGDLSKEFWLGNDKLYALTNQKKMMLRVDLEDFEGDRRYAEYSRFFVDSERALYTATFGTYRGDAGDSLGKRENNTAFSTKDKDNDADELGSCAIAYKGGWWYAHCHRANLNGLYLKGAHKSYADGIEWLTFRGHRYSLKFSEMKIRPVNYKSPFHKSKST